MAERIGTRRGRPPDPGRATQIADSVIAVLAESGARGLSHRAVDRHAGLPAGTTVHHAETRIALLVLGTRRMSEIGLSELGWLEALVEQPAPIDIGDLVERLIETWRERLLPNNRPRVKAEIAIALQSSRDETVRSAWQAPQTFEDLWTRVMIRLGARAPRDAAIEFTGTIRGRFYYSVLNSQADAEFGMIRVVLHALLAALIAADPADEAGPRPNSANTDKQ